MGITYIVFGLLQVSATLASLVSLNLTLNLWPVDKADKLDKPDKEGDLSYDFIIVGAGTAGCILAEQLSEDKRFKVAVFEAGGKPSEESMDPGYVSKLPNSPINWNFTSKYKPCEATQFKGNVYHFTSGKVIGGSSIMGYMVYARGAPHDLEVIAEAAKDNTYDYASITSYFKKSERLEDKQVLKTCYGNNYGKNGSMGMARQPHAINKKYLEAFSELNKTIVLDTNGPNTIGYAEPMFMISGGKRQSTALTSLARAAGRDNLDVFLNTEVTKILINTNNRAVGIHVKTNSGKIVTVKVKREVIVCAGVYKSPQLLMLSGIGIRKDLQLLGIPVKVDLPVGKYYKDHTGVYLNIKLNITTDKTPSSDPSEFPSPTIIGYDTLNKSQSYPDFRNRIFIIPSGSKTLLTQCSDEYSFKNEICDHFYSQTKGHEVMSIKIGQLHSMSQGEITLRSSNPDDQPDITPGYFSNEKDLENLVDYVLDILKIQDTKTFKKYNASIVYPDLPECDVKPRVSRDYWSCICKSMATSMYDTSGTCSIGPVVDNRLRVHQTEGIRVADASVLSYSPSGGVQAQTMTIAYKAADMIKEDNKNKVDDKDKNKEENTDKNKEENTDKNKEDDTDKNKEDTKDKNKEENTDKNKEDDTDKNKEDTKDKNKEENTDKNKEDNKNKQKENNILGLKLSFL